MKRFIQWLARFFGMVAIDWESAEYFSYLATQHVQDFSEDNHPQRRAEACFDLAIAMINRPSQHVIETDPEPTNGE